MAELTGPEPVAPAPPAVKKVTPKPVSEVDDDTLERELEALDIHALLPAAPTHEVGGLEQEDGQLPS